MLAALAVVLAFAPMPSRLPIAGECAEATPLAAGLEPPEDLIDPATFTITCHAVAVPSSQVIHLLAINAWSEGAATHIETLEANNHELANGGYWLQGAAIGFGAGVAAVLILR
jgi:hypothetical protein